MNLYKENLGGTTNYNIFVPENVTEDTEVLFYAFNHGFTQKMKDDIIKQNGDVIVIVPENTPVLVGNETVNHQYQSEAIDVFNLVKERYNLETTQFSQAGYSASYGCSIRTMADYIKSNPNAERQILISVDGCESDHGFAVYKSEYEAISQNNPIIISYAQKYRQKHEIRFTGGKTPILFVLDPDIPENSNINYMHYHNIVPNNFTERGLYNDLMNFATGKSELPAGYRYQMYNPATGLVEDINPEDAATLMGINTNNPMINKLYSLRELTLEDMSVTSNSTILLEHINNIIGKIKGSSFVQNRINTNLSFNSTTKVPSQISEVVQNYYDTTTSLLLKISNETYEFAKIGEQFEKDDKELKQEATNLNDIIISAAPVTQVENAITNASQSDDTNISNNSEIKVNNQNKVQPQGSNSDKIEETKHEEPKKEEIKPSNESNHVINNDNNNSNSINKPTQSIPSSNKSKNTIEDFPDFKEVYSDESRIVYDYKDDCRIIIHKNGDEITGIEHYYKFDNESIADNALGILTDKYKFDNNIENIIQKGNYVKVVFKDEIYANMTLDDIKNKYKDLTEVFKI